MRKSGKCGIIFLIAAMLILSAAACGKKSDFVDVTELQQYKTDYVGDAPNVSKIVSTIKYPKGYSYDHIEIQSETEPYGLMVYLKVEPKAAKLEDELQINADTAFDLIGNLGTLDYIDTDSKEVLASYETSK